MQTDFPFTYTFSYGTVTEYENQVMEILFDEGAYICKDEVDELNCVLHALPRRCDRILINCRNDFSFGPDGLKMFSNWPWIKKIAYLFWRVHNKSCFEVVSEYQSYMLNDVDIALFKEKSDAVDWLVEGFVIRDNVDNILLDDDSCRRVFDRFQLKVPVKCVDRASGNIAGELLNISQYGLQLKQLREMSLKQSYHIAMELPDPVGHVKCDMECRWIQYEKSDDTYRVGYVVSEPIYISEIEKELIA